MSDTKNIAKDGYGDMMDGGCSKAATTTGVNIVNYEAMALFYENYWLASEIAETIVIMGLKDLISDETKQTTGVIELQTDSYMAAYKLGRIYNRVFGWSLLVPIIDRMAEGTSYSDPITSISQANIRGWRCLTPLMVQPSTEVVADIFSSNFGKPSHYNVTGGTTIHASNTVLIADNKANYRIRSPILGRSFLNYCKPSVLRYDESMQGISRLMAKAHVDVLLVDGFTEVLENEGCQVSNDVLNYYGSIGRRMNQDGIMVLDGKDQLAQRSAQLGGYSQLIGDKRKEVCGVANIPEALMFSEAYGGIINGGGGDMERFLSYVDIDRQGYGKDVLVDTLELLDRLGFENVDNIIIPSLVDMAIEKNRANQAVSTEEQIFDSMMETKAEHK